MIGRSKIYLSDQGIYLMCILLEDLDKTILRIKEVYPKKSEEWYQFVRSLIEGGLFSELSEELIDKLYGEESTRARFMGFDRR